MAKKHLGKKDFLSEGESGSVNICGRGLDHDSVDSADFR